MPVGGFAGLSFCRRQDHVDPAFYNPIDLHPDE